MALAPGPEPFAHPQPALEHARHVARELSALSDSDLSRAECERVIRVHAEAGLVEECLSWLRRMRRVGHQPSLESYGLVVAALTAAGRRREAARWLRRVVQPEVSQLLAQRSSASTGVAPTLAQYNEAMIAYGAAGQPVRVKEILRQMVNAGRHMPAGQGGGGGSEGWSGLDADELVTPGPDARRGGSAHTSRPKSRIGASGGGAGLRVQSSNLRPLGPRPSREGGVAPDVVSFNSLIAAFARSGSPDRARAWIGRMRSWGIAPDVCSYTTVIAGFARAGEPDRAREVMSELQAAASVSPSVVPDVCAYSALVEAYARVGRPTEAAHWLGAARRAGVEPNVVTFGSVAKGHAVAGDFEAAHGVLDQMEAAGVLPNTGTYQALISCCARAGKADEALRMLSRMSSSGARQAGNATLGGECRAAGGDGGSRGAAPSTLAYNLVLGCLSRAGRHAEAEALMGQMHQAGVPPDAVTFSSLISLAPAATTAPSRAAEWLSAMKELGVAPDVQCYNKVLACCARARLPELAEEWLDKMEAAGVPPDLISYSTTISAYAKLGQPDKACEVLRRMQLKGIRPDAVLLNTLLEAHARALQPLQAAAVLAQARRGELGPAPDCVSYTIVMSALARAGDSDAAERWFEVMRTEERIAPDVQSFNVMVRGLASNGRLDDALKLLDDMRQAGLCPDQWTYGPLLEGCRAGSRLGLARALGAQMLAGDAYSTFCLVSLRRSIGASQLRALCRHAGVLDRAVVRQALGKSPRPAAAQAAQA